MVRVSIQQLMVYSYNIDTSFGRNKLQCQQKIFCNIYWHASFKIYIALHDGVCYHGISTNMVY